MPAFWDFSAALPWVGGGFIAGLLIAWLIRKLTGIDAKRIREIQQLNDTVNDARRAHAAIVATNTQLESERARLTAQVNELSPRAGLVPQFERQVAELRQSLQATQSALDAAKADADAIRQDAEIKGSTAKYYEEEYGRLHAAHQALSKDATSASALVSKLQGDYAAASQAAQDSVRLRSEIGTLRAQLENAHADLAQARATAKADLAREQEAANQRMAQLQSTLAAREAEIARLREDAAKAAASAQDGARLSAEVARLSNELQRSEKTGSTLAADVERLTAQLAAAPKQDFSADVARLQNELALVRDTLSKAQAQERSTAMELSSARTDLGQARTALEETTRLLGERHGEVEELRAKLAAVPDIESYRRFKDALDAANRIAAGLPEKS
jgi:chromosome segregation ATPase